MKHLKLKQGVKDFLGVLLLYIIVIVGIIILNYRLGELNGQKNTSQQNVELVQLENAS